MATATACSSTDPLATRDDSSESSDTTFVNKEDEEINDMKPENAVSKEWMDVILKIGYCMQELGNNKDDDLKFNEVKLDALVNMKLYAKMHFNFTNSKLYVPDEHEFVSTLLCTNFEKVVDAMFEATRKTICIQFPLFLAYANTPFLCDMWRLFYNYTENEHHKDLVNVGIIAFQSFLDTPILHFDARLEKKDDEYKNGIELSPDGFRVLFSSHLKTFSEWKNNPELFKRYTFNRDNAFIICPERFEGRSLTQMMDVCTYTLLCLYDHEQENLKIGGFDGIDINLQGKRICFPHYIRNDTLHRQFLKRQQEKELEDNVINDAEWNEFILGSVMTTLTIPKDQTQNFMCTTQLYCKKIAEISEAELPNYEEHIEKMNAIPESIISKV